MSTLPPVPSFERRNVIGLFHVVLYAALIAAFVWLFWTMRSLFPPILVAATIAVALAPEIDYMEKRGMKRMPAVLLIYCLFFGITFVVGMVIVQNIGGQLQEIGLYISSQSQNAFSNLIHEPSVSHLIDQVRTAFHPHAPTRDTVPSPLQNIPLQMTSYFSNTLVSISSQLPEVAGNLVNAVIVPILAFYLLVDYHNIVGKMLLFVRPEKRENVLKSMADIVMVFGQYVRGVVIMVLIDIFVTWIILRVFHVRFAETVALVCGVLYAVPYLGALVSTLLIFLMAWLGLGIAKAVVVLIIMIVIHQLLFDQVVAPKIIGKQVDLHPLLAFLAMLVGGTLFGVGGTLLAVPIAAASRIILVRIYPRLQEQYDGATIMEKQLLDRPIRRSRKPMTKRDEPKKLTEKTDAASN